MKADMKNSPASTIIRTSEDFKKLRSDWDKLIDKCKSYTVFSTWRWMYTWWEVYKNSDMELFISTLYDEDKLVSISPFYIKYKVIYIIGSGEEESEEVSSEYLDIICLPEYASLSARMIADILSSNHEFVWNKFVTKYILENSTLNKYFLPHMKGSGYRCIKHQIGFQFLIGLPKNIISYMDSLKPKFRLKVKNRINTVNTSSFFSEKVLENFSEIDYFWNTLRTLHELRWEGKNKPGAFTSEKFSHFHKRMIEHFLLEGNIQLLILYIHNKPMAAIYNFGIGEVIHYYQSGFDPAYAKEYSPGNTLIIKSIEKAILSNIDKFDLMVGPEDSYKREYSADKGIAYNITIFNNNLYGTLSSFLAKIKSLLKKFTLR